MNLTYASDSTAVIRVDTSTQNQTNGRMSVRLTSNNQYDDGLFIFDVVHTPYGCATWPALWLTDPDNWPEHGEIDVMESNNKATKGNDMTLHTSKDCKMNVKRKESGSAGYTNCLATANDNAGCGVTGKKASSGEEFNDNGGGVSIFFFCSKGNELGTDVCSTRSTQWSSETPGFESGCLPATTFQAIFPILAAPQILRHGARQWQTFLAPTVTSAHTLRIKASLPILIFVAILPVQAHTTQICTTVPTHARSGLQRTEPISPTHTGSLIASRCTKHRHSFLSVYIPIEFKFKFFLFKVSRDFIPDKH